MKFSIVSQALVKSIKSYPSRIMALAIGFMFSLGCMSAQNPKSEKAFQKMVNGLISHSVPTISTEKLDSMGLKDVILLDAREWNEFQTSHLQGATWVGFNSIQKQVMANLPKDKPVVVYCSVGYRSEKIGEKLAKMGYSEVYNLYGGIFDWVNKDKPLVDQADNPTQQVHAYNQKWGKWLNKGEKVYK